MIEYQVFVRAAERFRNDNDSSGSAGGDLAHPPSGQIASFGGLSLIAVPLERRSARFR